MTNDKITPFNKPFVKKNRKKLLRSRTEGMTDDPVMDLCAFLCDEIEELHKRQAIEYEAGTRLLNIVEALATEVDKIDKRLKKIERNAAAQ